MEDGVTSLAFGHRDIPARQVDIEDETPGGVVLTNAEGRERGLFHNGQRDPTLINSRPTCIWQERQSKRVKTAKDTVLEMLGFNDEDEEEIAEEDDEDEVCGGRSRTTSRGNPYILSSCAESRKRRHDDSDSD